MIDGRDKTRSTPYLQLTVSIVGFLVFAWLYHRQDLSAIHFAPTILGRMLQIRTQLLEYLAALLCVIWATWVQIPSEMQRISGSGQLRVPQNRGTRIALLIVALVYCAGIAIWLGENLFAFVFPAWNAALQMIGSALLCSGLIFGPFIGNQVRKTRIPFIRKRTGDSRATVEINSTLLVAVVLFLAMGTILAVRFASGLFFPAQAGAITAICAVPLLTACLIFWLLQWAAQQE